MSDSSLNPWIVVAAVVVAIGVALAGRTMLPRYEWRVVGDGHAVVVYDKWSGRFQRTEWNNDGKPHLSDVYTAP